VTDRGRIILGIDPGTAATGFGIVEQRGNRLQIVDHGVIETSSREEPHHRLAQIYDAILEVMARHRPDAAAVESLFFNVNVRTALAVGQSRGVALLACSRSGCSLFEYTPQQIKQAVVGYGKADKKQVQEMVRVLLALQEIPRPDHAADALAVAVCHAHSHGVRSRAEAALLRAESSRHQRRPA
jgi:crossover junction endodeoxyribonuclease RuvC